MTVVPLPPRFTGRPPSRKPGRSGTDPSRPGPVEVRLAFEVVLGGETRYTDALEVIDGVRRLTESLGSARSAAPDASPSLVALVAGAPDAPQSRRRGRRSLAHDGRCAPQSGRRVRRFARCLGPHLSTEMRSMLPRRRSRSNSPSWSTT